MISILTQRTLKLAAMKVVKGRKRLLGQNLPEPTIYYFGYGANLDLARFEKYSMNVAQVGVAKLENHVLTFSLPCEYAGKGYASIEPKEGSEVWGVLYKIDRPSLFLLDVMEWAVLNQYRRHSVEVTTKDGKSYRAHAYQARFPRTGLVPSVAYKKLILKSAKANSFPETYIKAIELQPAKDKFNLDPGFSFIMPARRRFLEKHLGGLYLKHDKFREKVCEWLRF